MATLVCSPRRWYGPRNVSGLRIVRIETTLTSPQSLIWRSRRLVYIANLFQALHYDKQMTSKRVRLFWIVFAVMFCWEIIPECASLRAIRPGFR